MIIYIDIDETICEYNGERRYENAIPIQKNIELANRLYDEGNDIVYWTARGSSTGIDWRETTEGQLKKWGVKYHDLKFGKPEFDLLIDDKAISSFDLI